VCQSDKDYIAILCYIFTCRFSSFSSFSSTNGGGIPSRNVKSVSTSTKIVNGKKIVTKRFADVIFSYCSITSQLFTTAVIFAVMQLLDLNLAAFVVIQFSVQIYPTLLQECLSVM